MATTTNHTSDPAREPDLTTPAPATERGARSTGRRTTGTRTTTRRSNGRTRTATAAARGSTRTSTQPRTRVEEATHLASRALFVPVGAGLIVRDDVVSTVRDLAARYGTIEGIERELKRYERRGGTARNRFEKQVRRARTKFERDLRSRRRSVERVVRQNRRQLEGQVRNVRRDLDRQSKVVTGQFEKIVSSAHGLIS